MFSVSLFQNFVDEYNIKPPKVYELNSRVHIHFSLSDILFKQNEIVGLWRAFNKHDYKPIAKTFLGKITSISIVP